MNPITPSLSSLGEAFGDFYRLYTFNKAIEYAASTPSRTFGATVLIYPFKSGVFRGLLTQAGRGTLVGVAANVVISELQALVNEYKASRAGDCQ